MSGECTVTSRLSSLHKLTPLQELEYMAYHGRYTAVYELYKKIPLPEREAYQSVSILSSVVNGGIARLEKTKEVWRPTTASVICELISDVEHDLDQFISYCALQHIAPRQLYTCILDWSNALANRAKPAEALHFLEKAEDLSIRMYPDLYARLILKRAAILFETGRFHEAHHTLSVIGERCYLIPDWNLISEILLLFSKTSLLTGEPRYFKTLLFSGLRHFYTRTDIRRLFTDQLSKTYRRPYRVLLDRDRTVSDKILFVAHWLDQAVNNSWTGKKSRIDRLTIFAVLVIVYFFNYSIWQKRLPLFAALSDVSHRLVGAGRQERTLPAGSRKAILVTRAVGGIGDFLTMTPGFHALKAMYPDHEIHLAIPRQYQPLFIGNLDVAVLDIEQAVLDIASYVKWFNFTDCPASRTESRTAPNVRMSRIDIFARALGIRGWRLRTMDRRPRYFITEKEKEFQRKFWKERYLDGKAVIGVQLQAAEPYKDYPHMEDLVRRLAAEFMVIIFHTQKMAMLPEGSVIDPGSISLREAFALAAACDAIVAPDSAFVHFAGAFDIPCVALEGPIGKIGTKYYSSCTCVDARNVMKCIPCWRNQSMSCKLTGMRDSVCMEHITTDMIYSALRTLLTQRASRGGFR